MTLDFNLNNENILTILILVPCSVIMLLLLLNVVEIIDIFYRQFWDVLYELDPTTAIFRNMLGIILVLSVILCIIGFGNCSSRPAYFVFIMFILCCIIIICSWVSEWIVVRNLDSTIETIHNRIEQRMKTSENYSEDIGKDKAYKLMRLIPCCGYENYTSELSLPKYQTTCFEYVESTLRYPPLCKDAIDAWFEDNLLSALGLFADFRIMCILILISIIILVFAD